VERVVLNALESEVPSAQTFSLSSKKLIDRMNAKRRGTSNFGAAK
jgi:hypothetical protein